MLSFFFCIITYYATCINRRPDRTGLPNIIAGVTCGNFQDWYANMTTLVGIEEPLSLYAGNAEFEMLKERGLFAEKQVGRQLDFPYDHPIMIDNMYNATARTAERKTNLSNLDSARNSSAMVTIEPVYAMPDICKGILASFIVVTGEVLICL